MKAILTMSLLLTIKLSSGQFIASDYLKLCDSTYSTFTQKLAIEERAIWDKKLLDLKLNSTTVTDSINSYKEIYTKLKREDLYAYQYLNGLYDYLVPRQTDLLNELGKYIFQSPLDTSIKSKMDLLNRKLTEYSNTQNAKQLGLIYSRYLILKDRFNSTFNYNDHLIVFIYKPTDNPYSSPYKTEEYKIVNWPKLETELKSIEKELLKLENEFLSIEYTFVKEPLPYIPLMFQFSTLIVLISNLLVNFGFNAKTKFIFLLVLTSVLVFFFLLFISSNTFMNAAINVFVPGIMYLIYYRRQKKLPPTQDLRQAG